MSLTHFKLEFVALASLFISVGCYAEELKPLSVFGIGESLYFAGSRTDPSDLGGFYKSDNMPQGIKIDKLAPPNTLSLVVLADQQVTYSPYQNGPVFRGFQLMVFNRSGKEVTFRAQDSRVHIIRQAQTPEGVWKPIEHMSHSDCGNSYHRVFLPDKHCWTFAVPVFAGSLKTKMRFLLVSELPDITYSNEFDGFINTAQWTEAKPDSPAEDPPKIRLTPPPCDPELKRVMELLR
ncbi:hypothetical protein [Prosthecobacter sp.]|jgi:hypothetical protein|uniref:hypothetical protein n=1 Tax=Prosthecobacter sp. TaxID=1965333 RepID=UPI0037C5F053